MNRRLAAIAVLCAVAGIGLYFNPSRTPVRHDDKTASEPVSQDPPSTAVPAPGQNPAAVPTASPTTTPPPASSLPNTPAVSPSTVATASPAPPGGIAPATVLDNLRVTVREYGLMFGGNPVGTNPEITKALNGGNPKHANFIRPDAGLRINEQGEMVDPWGTPFFFHQLSGTEMEIRSAGPDRVMWTADDLVTR